MITVTSKEELLALSGKELGTTDFITITQDQIQKFADATFDQQWIHTDPERAAEESPFKKTIAHGYLTLSLAPNLFNQLLTIEGAKLAVNYGIDKLRFLEPVPVDSKLALKASVKEASDVKGRVKLDLNFEFLIEGGSKPACLAEVVYLFQF